tara:strand:+ start:388 stop:597 length:210 start_codon:yes stop_codon:yes gene_type:complete
MPRLKNLKKAPTNNMQRMGKLSIILCMTSLGTLFKLKKQLSFYISSGIEMKSALFFFYPSYSEPKLQKN